MSGADHTKDANRARPSQPDDEEILESAPVEVDSQDSAAGTAGADGNNGDGRKPQQKIRSYALLEPETMSKYMSFYKHTYGQTCIDRKTKEFIALAAALMSGCKNCLEGHLEKAIKHGATRAEISEVLAITLGVNAATIVDRSDIAAANLGIDLDRWSINGKST
jgi:AhpD family alkylhydroperoxidase